MFKGLFSIACAVKTFKFQNTCLLCTYSFEAAIRQGQLKYVRPNSGKALNTVFS